MWWVVCSLLVHRHVQMYVHLEARGPHTSAASLSFSIVSVLFWDIVSHQTCAGFGSLTMELPGHTSLCPTPLGLQSCASTVGLCVGVGI